MSGISSAGTSSSSLDVVAFEVVAGFSSSAGAAATGINQVGKQLGKEENNNIESIILYLKKIIDSKTEDTDNEISCDEYPVDDVAVPSIDSSDIIEEDVPSTTDCSEGE